MRCEWSPFVRRLARANEDRYRPPIERLCPDRLTKGKRFDKLMKPLVMSKAAKAAKPYGVSPPSARWRPKFVSESLEKVPQETYLIETKLDTKHLAQDSISACLHSMLDTGCIVVNPKSSAFPFPMVGLTGIRSAPRGAPQQVEEESPVCCNLTGCDLQKQVQDPRRRKVEITNQPHDLGPNVLGSSLPVVVGLLESMG